MRLALQPGMSGLGSFDAEPLVIRKHIVVEGFGEQRRRGAEEGHEEEYRSVRARR